MIRISRELLAIFIACSVLLTSGCVSQKESMVKQGYPLAYADGFEDGCHSGNKAGGSLFEQFKKDVRRFNADSQYAQGWSDAFRQCETEQESLQRQIRMGIEQQKLMEQKKHNDWVEDHHLGREVFGDIDGRELEKNLRRKYK